MICQDDGKLDCMHWEWKNCPTSWKGQYTCGFGKPTFVFRGCSFPRSLYITHFFWTYKYLKWYQYSWSLSSFDDISQGRAPKVTYLVNGNEYQMSYYLTDGSYSKWATFIKSILLPQNPKSSIFATNQEDCRKDVERA